MFEGYELALKLINRDLKSAFSARFISRKTYSQHLLAIFFANHYPDAL